MSPQRNTFVDVGEVQELRGAVQDLQLEVQRLNESRGNFYVMPIPQVDGPRGYPITDPAAIQWEECSPAEYQSGRIIRV
jgi:hypothetical protein